ncbi:MAG: DJ-1/PfpI family protein [Verrucomicrobiota bacterium JB022]|nr:DJ-1/PfpI family protein [Verrucomicrobiota bacterium JB022]
MTAQDFEPLQIGILLFPRLDQIDLTGPYEVLASLPNVSLHLAAKTLEPVCDYRGLGICPTTTLAAMPEVDVLLIPGGPGQEALMEDDETLDFIRRHTRAARHILSVCTGALLCGAAGLLVGKRATTHWTAIDLLPYFGAVPVRDRVVTDGKWIFAGGVTAGIDGALRLAALLRGEAVAQQVQLRMQYEPEPPFDCGTPERAPASILQAARDASADLTAARLNTAQKIARRLGVDTKVTATGE